jgi:CAAX protease family protein
MAHPGDSQTEEAAREVTPAVMADAGPAESQTQRTLAFVALGLMGVSAALAPHSVLWIRVAPLPAALLVAGFGLAHPGPGAGIAVLSAAISVTAASGIAWQAVMPVALGVYFLASWARPALGSLRERMGRVPLSDTIGCAAVTPLALVGWFLFFQPDMSAITRGLPKLGTAELAVGMTGFVLVNAFCEELIWRGVIQTQLSAFLSERDAIFVQAVSFGAQHAHGIPRGIAGVVLAGAWAMGLGVLRRRAGGLLAVTLAHIVADATIAVIVVLTAARR